MVVAAVKREGHQIESGAEVGTVEGEREGAVAVDEGRIGAVEFGVGAVDGLAGFVCDREAKCWGFDAALGGIFNIELKHARCRG